MATTGTEESAEPISPGRRPVRVPSGGAGVNGRSRIAAAMLTVLLAGCGTTGSVALLGTGMASFISTDKLPTDYVAEAATGLDCSALRASRDGGPVCRDKAAKEAAEEPVYCYRTLARINCYDKPNPYGASTVRVH